jgi:hypothetical protein
MKDKACGSGFMKAGRGFVKGGLGMWGNEVILDFK